MSKLAHSDQPSMDKIARERFERDNNVKIVTLKSKADLGSCTWAAWFEGQLDCIGYGETEQEAISELIDMVMK